jgi:hypothetical protein
VFLMTTFHCVLAPAHPGSLSIFSERLAAAAADASRSWASICLAINASWDRFVRIETINEIPANRRAAAAIKFAVHGSVINSLPLLERVLEHLFEHVLTLLKRLLLKDAVFV